MRFPFLYARLNGRGATVDTTVELASEAAARGSVRDMRTKGSVMRMVPLDGSDIPAGGSVGVPAKVVSHTAVVRKPRLANDDQTDRLDRKVHMKWERRILRIVALACGLLVSSCGEPGEPGAEGLPEGTSEVPQPYLAASPGPGGPVGIVLETMAAGGYTYARIGADDTEIWVAGPMAEIAVGDTVSLAGADNMGPFSSPSLDRTFEEIYFIDQFRTAGTADPTYQGTVTQSVNAAGYTYVQVSVGEEFSWMRAPDTEEGLVWLAGPETVLSVGDVVSWQGGSVMREFHSNTLERTFAEIVFVSSLTVVN